MFQGFLLGCLKPLPQPNVHTAGVQWESSTSSQSLHSRNQGTASGRDCALPSVLPSIPPLQRNPHLILQNRAWKRPPDMDTPLSACTGGRASPQTSQILLIKRDSILWKTPQQSHFSQHLLPDHFYFPPPSTLCFLQCKYSLYCWETELLSHSTYPSQAEKLRVVELATSTARQTALGFFSARITASAELSASSIS